ncbi:MAG: class I SAM-dependent methyltransferase [Lachnospiraceae bacterium]
MEEMNELIEKYDIRTAAAWIRGHAMNTGIPLLPAKYLSKDIVDLSEEELCEIVKVGQKAEMKLYPFKNGTQVLPRVRRTIGFLYSLQFETMLDVGSGRGVFLIPFMKEFPWIQVTALDLLDKRITFLNELSSGGFTQLHAKKKNICDQPFAENSFDVVTMLEVLEHIPDVEKAIAAAVKMAKQYVVVSVPSKSDDNPEHIHLLTKEKLTRMFGDAGCTKLHFDGVEGHLFMVATIE